MPIGNLKLQHPPSSRSVSVRETAHQWIEAIVMPREDGRPYRPAPLKDRRALQRAACDEGDRFRDSVVSFLYSHGLMEAVRWLSDNGSMPMVTLHCTPRVLERLQQDPQFEAGRSLQLEVLS
jgi:hypothetical protein